MIACKYLIDYGFKRGVYFDTICTMEKLMHKYGYSAGIGTVNPLEVGQ